MTALKYLILKDCRNLKNSFFPAALLGIPLFMILGFGNEIEMEQALSWRAAFWLCFFLSLSQLFYRSFALEHQNRNFQIYSMLQVARWKILVSQALVQTIISIALGLLYLVIAAVFFQAPDLDLQSMLLWIVLASVCVSLPGSFLGLFLQFEREFLFSLFFLPLITPVILACHSLSNQFESSWLYSLFLFFSLSGFLSLFLFEFFFDELT